MEKRLRDMASSHSQAVKKAEMEGKAKKFAALEKKAEEEAKIEKEQKALSSATMHYHKDSERFRRTLHTLETGLTQDKHKLQKASQDKEAIERKLLDMHEFAQAQARKEAQIQREIAALKSDVDGIKTRSDRKKLTNPESDLHQRGESNARSGIDAPIPPPLG